MRSFWVLVVACSKPAPVPAVATPGSPVLVPTAAPHGVMLVAEVGATLQWFEAGLAGVQPGRSVALPKPIATLSWLRDVPVVLLEDHRVAIAGTAGLEFVALPPASAWAHPRKPDLEPHAPEVRMFTTATEIWVGRCEAGYWNAFMPTCDDWLDLRVWPRPGATKPEPFVEPFTYARPKVTPNPRVDVKLVPDHERYQGKREKLVCTQHGVTIEDPPRGAVVEAENDTNGEGGRSDLYWVLTEPPVFAFLDWDNCRPCPIPHVFEGCAESKRFGEATFGPEGYVAIVEVEAPKPRVVSIYRNGREKLGAIPNPRTLAFVPRP